MSTQAGDGWWRRRTARRDAAPVVEDEAVVALEAASVGDAAGVPALTEISLTLWPGTARRLLGAGDGAARALFDLMSGQAPPSSGRVVLFGRETGGWTRSERAQAARRIGRVFADDRLLAHLSVFDNVALPLQSAGHGGREVRQRVDDMLGWIGLGDVAHATPVTLTDEQRRLAAIARAVIARPLLILAQSPLRDLSTAAAGAASFLLEEMARHGTAVLVASDPDGAPLRIAAPALRLQGGRLVEDGRTTVRDLGRAGAEP